MIQPVSNLDSSSVNIVPDEYAPNLALVYLRTRSGPQGPKPLHKKDFPEKHNEYIYIYILIKKETSLSRKRRKSTKMDNKTYS